MITIEYATLASRFSAQTQLARCGHSVLVMRQGQPYCLLAHPTILTDEEKNQCERITSTRLYTEIGHKSARVTREGVMYLVTAHGLARCCMVHPDYAERVKHIK